MVSRCSPVNGVGLCDVSADRLSCATGPVSGFGGLQVSCWPLVPKFAGSNPAEAVGFFRALLREGSKAVCPMSHVKKTRKRMRGSRSFRSKLPAISRPSSSSFHYQGVWWRHLAVQAGTTKDQGLYNKPSTAVHPAALTAGTLLRGSYRKS